MTQTLSLLARLNALTPDQITQVLAYLVGYNPKAVEQAIDLVLDSTDSDNL